MRREWNNNTLYHGAILRALPRSCGRVLDVGCGEGRLLLALSARAQQAIGIDLDCSIPLEPGLPANVSVVCGDVLSYDFAPDSFSAITAVAVLHHLPLERALTRFRELLEPGGVLVVLGLYKADRPADWLWFAAGAVAAQLLRALRGRPQMNAAACAPQQTLQEVRQTALHLLPGAEIKRRLMFRYTLVWTKPSSANALP